MRSGNVTTGARAGLLVVVAMFGAACAGSPTATAPSTATAPHTAAPPAATATGQPTASPDEVEPGPASGSPTATVEIAGQTFELVGGNPPVCSFDFGAQVSMASADAQTTLSVYVSPSGTGAFILTTHLEESEQWAPAGAAVFEVSGSTGTWSGTMRERESDRQEEVTVTVNCGG